MDGGVARRRLRKGCIGLVCVWGGDLKFDSERER